MAKKSKKISQEYFVLLAAIALSVVFLLLDSLGALSFLRKGVSFVMDPVDYQGSILGRQSREYLEAFIYLKDFRDEYNQMSIDIYEKEVQAAFYAILEEENEALRKQISLGDIEQKYLVVKVLSTSDYDFLRINKGEKDGVVVGDVVVLGNMLVGLVTRVDVNGALVRVPASRGSNLEVVVVKGDIDELRVSDVSNILTKGVAKGSSEGIRIENMSMSADIENGDIVVVNDSRVGQYLVLGYLTDLSDNPAATSRSGFVTPIVEYDRLVTAFVRIDF